MKRVEEKKTTIVTHAYVDGRLSVPEIYKPQPRKTDYERTVVKIPLKKSPNKPLLQNPSWQKVAVRVGKWGDRTVIDWLGIRGKFIYTRTKG